MRYIFFLGRTPALSLAEIQALLEKFQLEYQVSQLDPPSPSSTSREIFPCAISSCRWAER
jgi:tRNA G10  N-methylase Trm11